MNVCPKCKRYMYVPKYHIIGHCPVHGYIKPVTVEVAEKKKHNDSHSKIAMKNRDRRQRADVTRDGGRRIKVIQSTGRG